MVSQNDTSQLSSEARDYLAGLLGKERGEATNSSHVDDKNEDDEDHDDVAWSEETKVMMMTAAFLYCPNQERHLRQILKIMVHMGIIPQSPCHTWIIFQTKFRIFAFFLVHFAWFSFLFFRL